MSRILINEANGELVVQYLMLAETTADRLRGLLGRAALKADEGLLIRPCRSIHMWFMRFPIDAAFLDEEMRVVKVARNLRPWRLAWAPRQTRCVVETAAGTLDRVAVGDRLKEQSID
jgi:uncharacterized membrane protein (UPF0127 family)